MLQERLLDPDALVAAILQDDLTGSVLMLAWMNRAALDATLSTRRVTLWSRSRNELWVKGESSGNFQEVVAMRYDCDGDAILIRVKSHGPACHTGATSCFHNEVE
jgi:phosphoribosyl-AMP cyclohydrolase